jgi:copper chaperone
MNRVVLTVSGLHCASCGLLVDDALEDVPGVRASSTNSATGRCTVELDPHAPAEADHLLAAVTGAGYTAELLDPELPR